MGRFWIFWTASAWRLALDESRDEIGGQPRPNLNETSAYGTLDSEVQTLRFGATDLDVHVPFLMPNIRQP